MAGVDSRPEHVRAGKVDSPPARATPSKPLTPSRQPRNVYSSARSLSACARPAADAVAGIEIHAQQNRIGSAGEQ